ncbi:hypothetical protein AB6A40_003039 [Gnathostoma spinigerum]|uniref:Uncharacterized protein n=1 Tax=Gnathostoma spinigerum TaxID=75299 RepID=A0ABD6E9I7_9BILA
MVMNTISNKGAYKHMHTRDLPSYKVGLELYGENQIQIPQFAALVYSEGGDSTRYGVMIPYKIPYEILSNGSENPNISMLYILCDFDKQNGVEEE